jgi:hypothetical protein
VIAPNGYYISYNFNVQGADMQNTIDVPVMLLLNSAFSGTEENVQAHNPFSVYPNPASSVINVQLNSTETPGSIFLSDALGRRVETTFTNNGGGNFTINADQLARGIYTVTVESGSSVAREKIIIQ